MRFPDDFATRVERLEQPGRFVAEMMQALAEAERADARRAHETRLRALFDSLPAADQRRYAEIVNPRLVSHVARAAAPERQVFRARLEARLRWLGSDDPDAVARRAELWREQETQLAGFRAETEARRDVVEARLRSAGLPVLPELIDWLECSPWIPVRVAAGAVEGSGAA